MTYHICNRILYRGFRSYGGGKTKILRANGTEIFGEWRSGVLHEVIPTPVGGITQESYLCLTPSGRPIKLTRDLVLPETLGLFSGTMIQTEWTKLTKSIQNKWLKTHNSSEWKGVPVFEGDLFQNRISKELLVVVYESQMGIYLEDIQTKQKEKHWCFDLLKPCGNLWQPPKGMELTAIQYYHDRRKATEREDSLYLEIM